MKMLKNINIGIFRKRASASGIRNHFSFGGLFGHTEQKWSETVSLADGTNKYALFGFCCSLILLEQLHHDGCIFSSSGYELKDHCLRDGMLLSNSSGVARGDADRTG